MVFLNPYSSNTTVLRFLCLEPNISFKSVLVGCDLFYDTVLICMIPCNPCVLSRMTQAVKKVTHSTSNSWVMDREMTQIQLLTYLEIQIFQA